MRTRVIKYIHSDYLLEQADKNPAVKGRALLVHQLIASYGLLQSAKIIQPKLCNIEQLNVFHSSDYLQQLKECAKLADDDSPECTEDSYTLAETAEEYGLGFDCPVWSRIGDYVRCIAGATMTACLSLCKSPDPTREVIVNFCGGWHHAQREKAGGYCYVNDIVLGLLVMRKRFKRIFYVDLDIHHGDGVEAAFEATKRVFTLSFHQYECGFYPGTGRSIDCGFGGAKGYSANFPYRGGIKGSKFRYYFKRIVRQILYRYSPDACVIQCGADVIVGDPLGGSNLTPLDLINCISFLLQYDLPTILLGGGGYNFTNTSRYWTSLLASVCGQAIPDDIPEETPQFLKYGPDYSLNIEAKYMEDLNTIEYLEECALTIEDNLKKYHVKAI